MSSSSRRWTGVLIAVVLVAGTLGLAVWRLRVVHQRGWAGFAALPQKTSDKKPAPRLPFGWRMGSVFAVNPGSPAERAGIAAGGGPDLGENFAGTLHCQKPCLTFPNDVPPQKELQWRPSIP